MSYTRVHVYCIRLEIDHDACGMTCEDEVSEVTDRMVVNKIVISVTKATE